MTGYSYKLMYAGETIPNRATPLHVNTFESAERVLAGIRRSAMRDGRPFKLAAFDGMRYAGTFVWDGVTR